MLPGYAVHVPPNSAKVLIVNHVLNLEVVRVPAGAGKADVLGESFGAVDVFEGFAVDDEAVHVEGDGGRQGAVEEGGLAVPEGDIVFEEGCFGGVGGGEGGGDEEEEDGEHFDEVN